jgi:hypothetical protein
VSMHLILTGDKPVLLFICNCNAIGYGNLCRKHHKQKHRYSQQNGISITMPASVFEHSEFNLAVRRTMGNM